MHCYGVSLVAKIGTCGIYFQRLVFILEISTKLLVVILKNTQLPKSCIDLQIQCALNALNDFKLLYTESDTCRSKFTDYFILEVCPRCVPNFSRKRVGVVTVGQED